MLDLRELKGQLRGKAREIVLRREGRVFARAAVKQLREAIRKLRALEGFNHLSTITAIDVGSEIEVIYHISLSGALVSLKVQTPKENPVLPTIVDLIPGAVLYEREVHDMLGVNFEGHPDLSPLILPDKWPEGVYPLRKWWTQERILSKLGEVQDGNL